MRNQRNGRVFHAAGSSPAVTRVARAAAAQNAGGLEEAGPRAPLPPNARSTPKNGDAGGERYCQQWGGRGVARGEGQSQRARHRDGGEGDVQGERGVQLS